VQVINSSPKTPRRANADTRREENVFATVFGTTISHAIKFADMGQSLLQN
jgi:hypothetical protein